MNLRRKSDRPNRKRHTVRPAWEDERREERDRMTDAALPLRSSSEYRAVVAAVDRRSGGRCEVGMSAGCYGRGHFDPHHIYPTSEGGPVICPASWMLWVCRPCHAAIHGNDRPTAEFHGYIVPQDRKS